MRSVSSTEAIGGHAWVFRDGRWQSSLAQIEARLHESASGCRAGVGAGPFNSYPAAARAEQVPHEVVPAPPHHVRLVAEAVAAVREA